MIKYKIGKIRNYYYNKLCRYKMCMKPHCLAFALFNQVSNKNIFGSLYYSTFYNISGE